MATGNWTQVDVDAHMARRVQKTSLSPSDGAGIDTAPPKAKSKYHNVKTWVGSECFDSKREAEYWILLKAREALGEIEGLKRQVRFALLCPAHDEPLTPNEARQVAEYVADFEYYELPMARHHVVDAKGHRTREYLLKKKWLDLQDGIVIEEV